MAEASDAGAIALFGEKYAEEVRVVSIGSFSKELCGGTHVPSTGAIGLFKITRESSVGSGVRRIEAITGIEALEEFRRLEAILHQAAEELGTAPAQLPERLRELEEELEQTKNELRRLENRRAEREARALTAQTRVVNDVRMVVGEVSVRDMDTLRMVGDLLKAHLGSGIILIGTHLGDRANFVCMATDDIVKQGFHAGELLSQVARVAGGGGGGRPNMAQAGGSKPERLTEALEKGRQLLYQQFKC
jgi:alanyl-tRNA synthetase